MAAPVPLPDFGDDDHYVKTVLNKITPAEDPPSLRDLTNATRLVSDLLMPHGLARVTDETLVKAQEYKNALYARRQGPNDGEGVRAMLEAFREEMRQMRQEMRQERQERGREMRQERQERRQMRQEMRQMRQEMRQEGQERRQERRQERQERQDMGREMREMRLEMQEMRQEMRDTRIMTRKHFNLAQGSGEGAILEIVPFRDGTMPPPRLPPLASPLAVLQLSSRHLNEYHRGYLEGGDPPRAINTRRQNVLKAIGSAYTYRV